MAVTTTTCTLESLLANAPVVMKCVVPEETPPLTDVISSAADSTAAILALLFGAISLELGRRERKVRKQQDLDRQEEEHRAEQRRMRNQAERVAAWLHIVPKVQRTSKVIVENASDQPIWDVGVSHWAIGTSGHAFIPVLAAGARREFDVVRYPAAEGFTIEEAVEVIFRDNAGRDWRRSAVNSGALELVSDATFSSPDHKTPPQPREARFLRSSNNVEENAGASTTPTVTVSK